MRDTAEDPTEPERALLAIKELRSGVVRHRHKQKQLQKPRPKPRGKPKLNPEARQKQKPNPNKQGNSHEVEACGGLKVH